MAGEIEITVGDVNDVEAYVYARYVPRESVNEREATGVKIRGTLRGPYCETAHTLPADIRFRDQAKGDAPSAVAIVPDPCIWSPELPHVYQAEIEAVIGEQVIAQYRGTIGFRKAGTVLESSNG